jgi:hypothetical protein
MRRRTSPETEVSLPDSERWSTLGTMTVRRSHRPAATLAVVLILATALAYTSSASAEQLVHQGVCDQGLSHWRLRVLPDPEKAGVLIVRFALADGTPGDTWNLFLDQNGTGFFAGSRVSDDLGFLRVGRRTPDGPGVDVIHAAGHDVVTGEICRGRVRI